MKFVKWRMAWYAFSLLLLIPGLISLGYQGLNLGIDFTGGSLLQVKFEQNVNADQVRTVLDEFKLGTSSIQATNNNNFLIRTKDLSEAETAKIITEFKAKLGKMDILRNEKVGPIMGKELALNAIYALIIAFILMIIYITFRFEFKFGVAAILALLHDVFIVIGIFSIFQIETDSTFVAAILTIIGYSINDTIVIFDRIRENLRIAKKMPLDEMIDTSIKQTLARSINTVLAVMVILASLFLLGGETTRIFSLALLMGVAIGCYSSIFNASPIWYDLTRIFDGKKATQKI